MCMDKQTAIHAFLEQAKVLISQGHFDFVPRRKNMMSLAEYGLLVTDAREEIQSLAVSDYYSGPEHDRDRPGHIWVFKKTIGGTVFYIKLKIDDLKDIKRLKCISFHTDE